MEATWKTENEEAHNSLYTVGHRHGHVLPNTKLNSVNTHLQVPLDPLVLKQQKSHLWPNLIMNKLHHFD